MAKLTVMPTVIYIIIISFIVYIENKVKISIYQYINVLVLEFYVYVPVNT